MSRNLNDYLEDIIPGKGNNNKDKPAVTNELSVLKEEEEGHKLALKNNPRECRERGRVALEAK